MPRVLFSLLVAATAVPIRPALAQSPASGPSVRTDALVERYRQRRGVPGIAVAVVRNGRVIKARGYGFANLELSAPVTRRTRFGLGSISKQFTATAIMQLVEEGKVGLEEPTARYLDSLPSHWAPITVRQLLTHTSGLPEERWLPSFVEFDRHEHRQLDVLRTIFADSLEFAPGSSWAYRNSAYRLLGMIVERVSGQSYWSFLDHRIFRLLGMTATRSSDPRTLIPDRAKGYGRERGRIVNRDAVTESAAFSEGALMSSVLDLARWDSTLYSPTILRQETLDRMWTPVTLTDGTTRPYGLGWVVGAVNGIRTVSHGGSLPGFVTQISRHVGKRLTVIVLTNAEWASPQRLAGAIAGLYQPELAPRPEPAIEDPDPGFALTVRAIVEELARGELDRGRLTEEGAEELPADAVEALARVVRPLGSPRTVDLLERQVFGEQVWRRYRITLDRNSVLVTVLADRAGRVSVLDLEEAIVP
jgi:CubicO group peptidase (beta-lactamase class C family)